VRWGFGGTRGCGVRREQRRSWRGILRCEGLAGVVVGSQPEQDVHGQWVRSRGVEGEVGSWVVGQARAASKLSGNHAIWGF
jgi:hypothetical protein